MTATRPLDIATKDTVAFISEHVPSSTELLEIGCGIGDVALALTDAGYKVIGLDTDADKVEKARKKGALVQLAEWPGYESEPLDAIVFTRSLHHIHDLDGAIGHAKVLLKEGGKLLVEDFAYGQVDDKTIDWFMQLINTPEACDLIDTSIDHLVPNLLAADDPHEAWRQDHDHDLHTIGAMKKAIEEHFEIERYSSVPYLYRYLISVVSDDNGSYSFIKKAYQSEVEAGAAGDITLIGRRIVASIA